MRKGLMGLCLGLGAVLASGMVPNGHGQTFNQSAVGQNVKSAGRPNVVNGPASVPEAKQELRTITTIGTGTAKVVPDAVRVSFGVGSMAESLEAARSENEKQSKKILDALAALKIVGLEMKSTPLEVQRPLADNFSGGGGGRGGPGRARGGAGAGGPGGFGPGPGGFGAAAGGEGPRVFVLKSHVIVVRGRDREQLLPIVDRIVATALTEGANARPSVPAEGFEASRNNFVSAVRASSSVTQVEFFKEDLSEARKQALAKAVTAAMEDARVLADAARLKILDTIRIAQNQVLLSDDGLEITVKVSVTSTY
jgi:hypothetical protein